MTDSNDNSHDDYIDNLVITKVAEMTDSEFSALVERTRPPQLDPRDKATNAIRSFLGHTD